MTIPLAELNLADYSVESLPKTNPKTYPPYLAKNLQNKV